MNATICHEIRCPLLCPDGFCALHNPKDQREHKCRMREHLKKNVKP